GQIPQPLLDVLDPNLEDQLQARQPRVVAPDCPGARLQAPGVVGKGQLLEGEGKGVAGCEPTRPLWPDRGDQRRTYIKECVARSPAHPLEAAPDEPVAGPL